MTPATLEAAAPARIAEPPATAKPRPQFRKPDPLIVAELQKHKDENGHTNEQIGIMLGVHESYVSKFFRGRNDFDPAKMEAAVQDMLKSEALRTDIAIELFDTFFTIKMAGSFEMIRKTGDVGLIFASAGIGKTSALQIECAKRPLTLAITASEGGAGSGDLEGMIFDLIETKAWDNRTPRRKFISERLKASRRLLLIDNAHRLKTAALQWVFDLHDETGIPIALIGNPEVEMLIKRNDQMFSRIGLRPDLRVWGGTAEKPVKLVKDSEMEAAADGILSRMIPQWHTAIRDLALQVAWRQGHFRALRKTITLAHELSKDGGKLADPRTAFATAHKTLPRNYTLDGV